ncbi:GAF and ANTAR domain-containing protein [Microbacteriaceae bacterium VKM Ac-2855]|nr:GAF and ANTAR domain-containing protein [Microbacteriaceae bacterium VKM Ac-2855]
MPMELCRPFLRASDLTGGAISLGRPQGRGSVLVEASDERARRLDELQFTLGEGPQVAVWESGRPFLYPDITIATGSGMPVFAAAAYELGVRALFAFPVNAWSHPIGVVDLYRDVPGMLSTNATDEMECLAADVALPALRQVAEVSGLDAASKRAGVSGRREVHQATGMIMAQLFIGPDEALVRLRAYAFATDREAAVVAHDVVTRVLDFRELS